MKSIKFAKCNCKTQVGEFNINEIPLDCGATWDLISRGHTIGIFQLEKRLGQDWARKVKPRDLEELAILISILRPGPLESEMSQDYVDIKFGLKKSYYLHPSLEPILEPTHGCLIYQEQAIKIVVNIAGFSLEAADDLRKAIGKKKPELMARLKKEFIKGAKETNQIDLEISERIFGWIEKCQRYSFNKSHAISYAMISYQTAWVKCHFKHAFFNSWLTYSHYKQDPKDEIYRLVQDAKLFDVEVLSPDIRRSNVHFELLKTPKKAVAFGLGHIRGVGQAAIKKIVKNKGNNPENWPEFLSSVPTLHRNVGLALVKSGACDCYGMSRSQMVLELETILGTTEIDDNGKKREVRGLTTQEKKYYFKHRVKADLEPWVILQIMSQMDPITPSKLSLWKKEQIQAEATKFFDLDQEWDYEKLCKLTKPRLVELMKSNGYFPKQQTDLKLNSRRREALKLKANLLNVKLEDSNMAKSAAEKHYLGISLSCSPADDANQDYATHTCVQIARVVHANCVSICAIIDNVTNTKTRKAKKNMCFLTLSDSTYSLDAVVFPKAYAKNKAFCKKDLIILATGNKKNGSFQIEKIEKLI